MGRFSVALSHQLPGEQGAVMVGRKMLFSAQCDIVPETAAASLQEMGTHSMNRPHCAEDNQS